jgi:hypothetical protein
VQGAAGMSGEHGAAVAAAAAVAAGGGWDAPAGARTAAALSVPPPPSLLSLPFPLLEAVGGALYPDAVSLVRLAATSAVLHAALLDRPELWRRWVARRFGPAALPAEPPRGPVRAAGLEGFVFLQGMEPPRGVETLRALPAASPAELAAALDGDGAAGRAARRGAVARGRPDAALRC